MSVLNDAGISQIVCDECGAETPEFDSDEFRREVAAARAEGWHISQVHGEWRHACPACNIEHDAVAKARRKFGLV